MKVNIPIKPVPWARPRRKGNCYYDAQTADKGIYALYARMAIPTPLEGPLEVEMVFCVPKPSSWSKKKTTTIHHPSGRPDLSNYVKFAEDALNGIVWKDDAQIVKLVAEKRYGTHHSVELTVRNL